MISAVKRMFIFSDAVQFHFATAVGAVFVYANIVPTFEIVGWRFFGKAKSKIVIIRKVWYIYLEAERRG